MGRTNWKKKCEELEKEKETIKKQLRQLMRDKDLIPVGDTREYLKYIEEVEMLHGETSWNINRNILLEYFDDYTFEDEESLKTLIYVFLNEKPTLPIEYSKIEYLIRDLNKEYEFHASIDGLTMTIKDEIVERKLTFKEIDALFGQVGERDEKR